MVARSVPGEGHAAPQAGARRCRARATESGPRHFARARPAERMARHSCLAGRSGPQRALPRVPRPAACPAPDSGRAPFRSRPDVAIAPCAESGGHRHRRRPPPGRAGVAGRRARRSGTAKGHGKRRRLRRPAGNVLARRSHVPRPRRGPCAALERAHREGRLRGSLRVTGEEAPRGVERLADRHVHV